ncbi:hypothetical protein [Cognatilysobacter bugurensis]|uniref:Uncharacterized protein n=1 Tax=Cognatilysobacter bugurensis TaxID=543356 RepID=A0A918T4A3_9GAMM|nr:hypothetical protein [Lysobacter bugurensis]GHA88156.1 hypothetical protein GCM10007067_27740 [Lysobacter bugurensis]
MSHPIALLEQLACHATSLPCDVQPTAVAGFNEVVQNAMLSRDIPTLVGALGGRARMFCCVWAPLDDEPVPAEQPVVPDDEPESQERLVA